MNLSGKTPEKLYANVIMPLKFREYVTYAIPERLVGKIFVGSRVKAKIKFATYSGVVAEITETPAYDPKRVVELEDLEPFPPIRESELKFWKAISGYYMCSIGEVFKAASPYSLKPSEKESTQKKSEDSGEETSEKRCINLNKINPLSESQQKAFTEIKDAFGKKKTVLLKGVTGSGKTEIYIHLIKECLDSGKNVLYLLPEVAVSRQLSHRLETVFGDRMDIYHSKQTIAKRKKIIAGLAAQATGPEERATDIHPYPSESSGTPHTQDSELTQASPSTQTQNLTLSTPLTQTQNLTLSTPLTQTSKLTQAPNPTQASNLTQAQNLIQATPHTQDSELTQASPSTQTQNLTLSTPLTQTQNATLSTPLTQPSKLILGLRSALFLPYPNLGLIIVDEEHDSSYKQTDPAPRYNGRDSAIILGQIFGADILLGSATPSYESEFNVLNHKYTQVTLSERYHKSNDTEVVIVDMLKARRQRAVKGLFSLTLIKEIQKRLDAHEQVMVFRARRAYAPIVQCEECGEIPKCPHCNTRLTYHKFNGRLTCHYCGYSLKLGQCPFCGADAMKPVGAGTERVEEELRGMFPQARIARFDADTTGRRSEAEKILRSFAKGETDILVGTQMLSKGFDFANLTLVVVMQGESILAVNDFRGDEKAVQLLTQLKGRAGRREKAGTMLIQTSQAAHPVYQIVNGTANEEISQIFTERKEFGFPPFVRIIEIIIKDRYADRGRRTAYEVERLIQEIGIKDYSGPIAPPIDKIQEENILHFIIRLQRDKSLETLKKALFDKIFRMEQTVIINVDPL